MEGSRHSHRRRHAGGKPIRASFGDAFCSHWHLFRGTPSRGVVGPRASGGAGHQPARLSGERGRDLRHHRREAEDAGIPPPRALRTLQHRGSGHDRGTARRSAVPRGDPRLGLEGAFGHGLPSRQRHRSRILPDLQREHPSDGRDHGREHERMGGLPQRVEEPSRLLQIDGRHLHRPRSSDRRNRQPHGRRVRGPCSSASSRAGTLPPRPSCSAPRC